VADTEGHTGFLDHLASRGYRWSHEHCASCGKYWEPLDYGGLFPRCEGCSNDRTHKRRALFLAKESEEPPEVRFAGVFKAARVLLEDGADEDRVFPTLAWAGLEVRDSGGKRAEVREALAEASGNPEECERLTRDLLEGTGRISPIEVVGGVLVLERVPVAVKVWEGPEPEVWIEVMPRSKLASPAEVASAYEQTMKERELRCDEERVISLTAFLTEHHLRLIIRPMFMGIHMGDGPPDGLFPSPGLVGNTSRGLLEGGGLGEHLRGRNSGRGWKPETLVPAIVAFFLRTYGGMVGRKEVHKLINERVLDPARKGNVPHLQRLPEEGMSASVSNQLWENAKRAHKQLIRTMHSL
jgi:hypothetical protein